MKLTLEILPNKIGVCKLDAQSAVPIWTCKGEFFSITKTPEELSIVCSEDNIPKDVLCERGWRAFKVQGTLDFGLVGILAKITAALANAGLGIFAVSTYNTDYILVKEKDLEYAIIALHNDGHEIISN
ncbi:amino acid-binding protein [Sporomusaceae bacterium FL31]|nr:amino acid-binding protein [Sporomusaceae bacterium FL31]GCE34345.1 amino acid-binding protein [Sporomusaceae bacterium]